MGVVNDLWNRGWTAFMEKRFAEALKWQEQATARAEAQPAMLPEVVYDLAVIRLAAGDQAGALAAARRALKLNPKLAAQANVRPRPRGDPGGAEVARGAPNPAAIRPRRPKR